MLRVEGHSALASAELEEGHESFNNINAWDDVSDAVVTESPEYQCAAAAFEGTSSFVHSGPWEAQHKVQPVQFFVKGKIGMSTSVVRGSLEEVLSRVVGTDGLDVCRWHGWSGCVCHDEWEDIGLTFHIVVLWNHWWLHGTRSLSTQRRKS